MTVAISESGGLLNHDGSDDIITRVHFDSIPESVLTGRHPETPRPPNRPTGGATSGKETRPNCVSAQYVSMPSTKPVTPSAKPKSPSATAEPPTPAPGPGASRFPLSDSILDKVLNNQSVMEHLSTFGVTTEELEVSRRVINGELNLDAAMAQLQELFQKLPSGRRPSGEPTGGQPN
jgi:hypothetical protein